MLKKIVSFGFKHNGGEPQQEPGVVIVDVRNLFWNPFRNQALREKDGTDPAVQAYIRKTPNFTAKLNHLREVISTPGTEVAYIGCHGGRHRSVFVAEWLGQVLGVPVEHRDKSR